MTDRLNTDRLNTDRLTTDRLTLRPAPENAFATYLRDRRARLDPAAFGLAAPRRRTPGLRREEVAARAGISATWYTWLEQGRGGAPSAAVLDRLAQALMLTEFERDHLHVLALGRAPEPARRAPDEGVTRRLQRVLDAIPAAPAMVRTPLWDVVAWNRAAARVLGDFGAVPDAERNVLKLIFCNPAVRAAQLDWQSAARLVVGAFRADAARAQACEEVQAFVEGLSRASAEFAALWAENEVGGFGADIVKRWRLPGLGETAFDYSAFKVDGRPDLTMVVFTPATESDAARVGRWLAESA